MKLPDESSANLVDVRSSSPPAPRPRLNRKFSGMTPENVPNYGKADLPTSPPQDRDQTASPEVIERTRTPDIAVGAATPPAYDPSRPTAFGSPTTSAIAYPW